MTRNISAFIAQVGADIQELRARRVLWKASPALTEADNLDTISEGIYSVRSGDVAATLGLPERVQGLVYSSPFGTIADQRFVAVSPVASHGHTYTRAKLPTGEWTGWRNVGGIDRGVLSLDTDGVPYYDPSGTHRIVLDTDGAPVVVPAHEAIVAPDADGTPALLFAPRRTHTADEVDALVQAASQAAAWDQITGKPTRFPAAPLALSADWLHVGDSLTDDVVLGANQWCRRMANLDGHAHEVRGWYNQETFEIATRMGGTMYPVTVAGGMIPASGATVTVTGQRSERLAFGGYSGLMARSIPGWLHGRHGQLRNPDNAATMQFTPDDGQDASSASGAVWFQGDLDGYLNRITTIWVGTNDRSEETPDYLSGIVRQMVARLPHARFLVFGLFSDPNGTHTAASKAVTDAFRRDFPGQFFDPQAPLMTDQAATDAGITFTADDRADITAGHIPGSFRSDSIHLNSAGATALAHAVHREAVLRGWSL